MVLSLAVGEFGLQEKIGACNDARAIRGSQALACTGFKVMPPLVGRVNAAKTHAQRQFRKGRSAVFLPGRAIKKVGNWWNLPGGHHIEAL